MTDPFGGTLDPGWISAGCVTPPSTPSRFAGRRLRAYVLRVSYPDALFEAFMYPLEAVSVARKRRELMPRAVGDVLELGAGTGANVASYDPARVRTLTLTDLAIGGLLRERAGGFRRRAGMENGAVRFEEADAQELPFENASFDTVVFTLVFCSVPDQARGLAEVRRVLRPGGRVVFIEHVRPAGGAGRLVDAFNPVWHAATGECNINRDTAAAIHNAGFATDELTTSGAGFLIHGAARLPALGASAASR